MGHVEVGDIFILGEMDDLSQTTGLKDLVDLLEEIGETQDMTDQERPLVILSSSNDIQSLVQGRAQSAFPTACHTRR